MFEQKLKTIMEQINRALKNAGPDNRLPGNAFYLDSGDVLCCQRESGVHRFPYQDGGFTMWAFSNGVIFAVEGVLNVFRPIHVEHESSVNFFASVKQPDGSYFPISILGGGKQIFEPYNVKRYLVYTNAAAFYIADCDLATFAVRASVTANKQMCFSFAALNKTDKPLEYTLNTYIEALLKNGEHDTMWEDSRSSHYLGDGSFLLARNGWDHHNMLIERRVENAKVEKDYCTTRRTDYLFCQTCNIGNAESLKYGRFRGESPITWGSHTPVAAEILHLVTDPDKMTRADFLMTVSNSEEEQPRHEVSGAKIDEFLDKKEKYDKNRFANSKLTFKDWHNDTINANVLNNFLKNLQKQVDFCSMGENYVEHLLGVRDVFQQLEQAIIWSPELAREKMVRALGFIDPSGRAPRQFSIPQYPGAIPAMDLRAFIDQGNWILTTFYMYLAYTDDYSVLNEECGYYEFADDRVANCPLRNSVLEHLIRIADYLVSNIDREDGTNCLRILYGDWNDAIDGLGKTKDEGKRFGTGVSVMASLQLYRNLAETAAILKKVGGYDDKAEHYLKVRKELAEGLKKYAVETNDKGEKRLIHGWGDHISYKIGSFCDVDGESRISFAPFAYWAISDLISETPELRDTIVNSIHALDSKYGLLTNYPPFKKGTPGIGRIENTRPGFAENACAYVHGSMFSTMALFLTGDSEYAWKQIEKSIIINHPNADKSTFVMPNSYCCNESMSVDGSSQNDWFTGAGTVLYKNFYRFGFGIQPDLDGLTIQTAAYMPCTGATAEFVIKGKKLRLEYEKTGAGERKILVNGVEQKTEFDALMRTKKLYLPADQLQDGMVIRVID